MINNTMNSNGYNQNPQNSNGNINQQNGYGASYMGAPYSYDQVYSQLNDQQMANDRNMANDQQMAQFANQAYQAQQAYQTQYQNAGYYDPNGYYLQNQQTMGQPMYGQQVSGWQTPGQHMPGQQASGQQMPSQQPFGQQAFGNQIPYQQQNKQDAYQQAPSQQASYQQALYQQFAGQQTAYQSASNQSASSQPTSYQQASYQQSPNQPFPYQQMPNQPTSYQQLPKSNLNQPDNKLNNKPKPNKAAMVVSYILSGIGSVALFISVFLFVAFMAPQIFGIKPYAILTGSMEPTYPVGCLVYVADVNPGEIETKDVITFDSSAAGQGNMIVTHRVVQKDPSNRQFITKGDANEANDPQRVSYDSVIGKVVFGVPLVGYIAMMVESMEGKIAMAAVIVGSMILCLVGDQIRRRARKSARKKAALGR